MYARTRSLCRLICMKEAGLIDNEQWGALKQLETHHSQHLKGPLSMAIVDASVFVAMKTNIRISEVQEIYCTVCSDHTLKSYQAYLTYVRYSQILCVSNQQRDRHQYSARH